MRSFDVFDTVLIRSVGSPRAVTEVAARDLHQRGMLPVEAATVAHVRHAVEERLRLLLRRPPTLREIHDELALALGLASDTAQVTLQAELDWERRLSRAVPGAAELLAAARSEDRVCFVSDTPLPAAFLQELLTAADLWRDGDRVWSSADAGTAKKYGGGLFAVVAAELGVHPREIHHTGDNQLSDVAESRLRGWTAERSQAGELNRYERLLEAEALASAGLSSYLAGASRLARLRAVRDGASPDLASVAAGVAAPLLIGYSLWLLQQARRLGLRHLYFVARDGEALLEVIRPLARACGMADLGLHYLYGSRSAWHLASLHGRDEDLRFWLHGGTGSSAVTVLRRAGLTPELAYEAVPHPLLHPDRAHVSLTAAETTTVSDLLGSEPLIGLVRAEAARRHEILMDYLRQEALHTNAPTSGVVDVGWTGRTSVSLDRAMQQGGMPEVAAYLYVGMIKEAVTWSTESVRRRQHAFLFDHAGRHGMPGEASGTVSLVETFCSGSHGSVVGYRRDGDLVVPDLIRPRNDEVLDWGLPTMRGTMTAVLTELLRDEVPLSRPGDLRGAVDRVLGAFWEHPTPGEVRVWGSFPFESDESHRVTMPLAAPVRTSSVARELAKGRLRLRPASSWRAGTASVSAPPWRQVLRAGGWVEASGGRLRRLPHRVRLEVAARRAR